MFPFPFFRNTRAVEVLRRPVPYVVFFIAAGITIFLFIFFYEINFYGLLCGMWMLGTCVYFQLTQHSTSKRIFGHHPLNRNLKNPCLIFLHHLIKSDFFDTAWITRVGMIALICFFFTRYFNCSGVDNYHIITSISMRGKFWFMLASQNLGDLGSQSAQNFS